MPPKVEPWSPAWQRGAVLADADARADGQAAAEALGQRDHVGQRRPRPGGRTRPRCGRCRSGSRRARAARPCSWQASRAAAQVALGGRDDAALPLGRLQEDGGHVLGDRCLQGLGVAVGDEADGRAERRERRADRLLAGDRERAHGPAVEAVLGGDEHRGRWSLTLLAPHQLDRGLVGLGAGVGEEDRARRLPGRPSSLSASWTSGSCRNRLEVWANLATWPADRARRWPGGRGQAR